MVAHAADALGGLDILVNNAGMTHFVPHTDLDGLSESMWDDILRINVKGAYFASRAAMPHLRKSSDGCIVNVSSIAGLLGSGSSIAYAASKAALNSMTMSLARAFAPEVRVNAIAPGVILTRWVDGKQAFIDAYVEKAPRSKKPRRPKTWRTWRSSWPKPTTSQVRPWLSTAVSRWASGRHECRRRVIR